MARLVPPHRALALVALALAPVLPPAVADLPGEWLAGDFHVHTTFSHDVYGGPGDENTGLDEAYTLGFTPAEQVENARERSLDFVALTDHNTVAQQSDPGHAAADLVLVHGYEHSFGGHGQMLGARRVYDGGGGAAGVIAARDALRADGGAFQINHPSAGHAHADDPPDWPYGTAVVPDAVEVWNVGAWAWEPPMPASNDNEHAIQSWERFLNLGHRVAATGGSDNHWRAVAPVAGVGQPTTWVFARARDEAAILDGVRAGRTFVSHEPPALGGTRLFLEADADGDGTFESTVGDEVPASARVRVRIVGSTPNAVLRVASNAGTVESSGADGAHDVIVPAGARWVRAEVYAPAAEALRERCDAPANAAIASLRGAAPAPLDGTAPSGVAYCRNRLAMLALTSAIFVRQA